MELINTLLNCGRSLILAFDSIYPVTGLNISAWDMALCGTAISILIDLFFFVDDEASNNDNIGA